MKNKHSFQLFGLLAILLCLNPSVRSDDAAPEIRSAPAPEENTGSGFDVVSSLGSNLRDALIGIAGDYYENKAENLTKKAGEFGEQAKNSTGPQRDVAKFNQKTTLLEAKRVAAKAKNIKAGGQLLVIESAWEVGNSIADCTSALESGDRDAFIAAFNNGTKEAVTLLLTMGLSDAIAGPIGSYVVSNLVGAAVGIGVEFVFDKLDSQFTFWADLAWKAFYKDKSVSELSVSGVVDLGDRVGTIDNNGNYKEMKKLDIGIKK